MYNIYSNNFFVKYTSFEKLKISKKERKKIDDSNTIKHSLIY